MKIFEDELKNTLNRGNGIALICNMVECPNCYNNIWIQVGQHCGLDAVLEGIVSTDCYKCLTRVKFVLSNHSIQKDFKFMTISELLDIQFENLKQK